MDLALDHHTCLDTQPDLTNIWDKTALVAYLKPHIPDVDSSLQMTKIEGGQSNPTWILKCKNKSWVLRAKPAPASQLMHSAHAIEREFRILQALQQTPVPVPQVRVLCEDESILGVAFYVMDFVEGRIFRDATLPEVPPAERKAYFEAASKVLMQLHNVDWRCLGLSYFGRHDGYYTRLIKRWTQQYTAARLAPVDAMDKLSAWLPLNIPEGADSADATVITHGDYRIENLMFHPTRPEVVAVLDWELCTLGHPLSDLSYCTLAWHMPSGILRGYCDQDGARLGLPSEQEFIDHYAQAFQLDISRLQQDWPFYLAFNFFRLSAILEGIGQREREGMAWSSTAKEIAAMAHNVAKCGWAIAQGQAPQWDA
jgi:aminoglycoside phosphotransferase (APT) family kinase protein